MLLLLLLPAALPWMLIAASLRDVLLARLLLKLSWEALKVFW
jgi:hypothetical protein